MKACWKCNDKSAPLFHFALYSDCSLVQFHQLTHQRKADTRSLVTPPRRVGDPMKALEHGRKLFFGNTNSRVFYPHLYTIPLLMQRNGDRAFQRILEGIRQEV